MCFPTIPTLSTSRRTRHYIPRHCNVNNLIYPPRSHSHHITIKGGLWNCHSAAKNKMPEFIVGQATLNSLNFLALTETWITPNNTATPAALSAAHTFTHTPRPTDRTGGGTGILTSPKWKIRALNLSHLSLSTFEYHAIYITQPVPLTIIVLYRPPGTIGDFLEELDSLISSFPEDGTPLILLGDFNLPTAEKYLPVTSLLLSFDLSLTPSPPTHKAGNILDLVFTRACSPSNLTVTPVKYSDHCFITFSLSLSSLRSVPTHPLTVTTRRNLKTLDPSTLSSSILSSLPTPDVLPSLPPDTLTSSFLSSVSSAFDRHCPLSTRPARSNPPAPWLSETLRTERTPLRAAERKWHKTKQPEDLAHFHGLLSGFSLSLSTAKSSFYHTKIQSCTSNPRKLFSTFSTLLKPPPPPPPSSLSADDFVTYFEKKVDDISSSFSHLPQNTVSNTRNCIPNITCLSSFSPLSPDDVIKLVTSSRPTTCALDPIPSPLFQTIAPDLLPFITAIINSSVTSGCVPAAFKAARVSPLLKKPTLDPSDVKNYRPVSLLSFLSKTLERVVSNQLSLHLSQNNLLDPNQSGFKPAHSTETALLAVTEALHAAQAASHSAVLILLDLSAAFDTVNHQLLLDTLADLGITGTALKWFASYLSDRTYQVSWKGLLSSPRTLHTGVPQGSVLGPLLFSLYTKSLGAVISAHNLSYHCYADDTQLFLSFPPSATQVEERIAACLADISQWMSAHHLKLNPDKTELLFFPAKSCPMQDLTISIDNALVTSVPTARNLGVVLDSQLSFKAHIASVTRSCRFTLYNIRKIRPFLTQESAQLLIQTSVISKLGELAKRRK